MKIQILTITLFLASSVCFGQSFEWALQMGGASSDMGSSIAIDVSGNIYLSGIFEGVADFNPGPGVNTLTSAGEYDMFILKLDASGNLMWVKQIGGPGIDEPFSVALDLSGNIYITGGFSDSVDFDPGPGVHLLTSAGDLDVFICKLDASGNLMWVKQFGNADADKGCSITLDNSGDVYATGNFMLTVDFDPGLNIQNLTSMGSSDAFILKLNSDGDFIMVKQLGGNLLQESCSVKVDANGNIYTTGYFEGVADFDPGPGLFELTSSGYKDIYISKLDPQGNFIWAKKVDGPKYDYGYSLAVDGFENVYITGAFFGTADFDPGTGIYPLTSFGERDIFVLKLDVNGDFTWAKQMGGPDEDQGWSVFVDLSGNVYTTGFFLETADFDPGPGTCLFSFLGGSDFFISKLDPQGNFVWARQIGSPSADGGSSVIVDAANNVYILGYFMGTADFDPDSVNAFIMTTAGQEDVFLLKLSQLPTGVKEINNEKSISIYPNPATDKITVKNQTGYTGCTYSISDPVGRVLISGSLNEEKSSIDIENLAPGLYLFSQQNGRQQNYASFIVQSRH
ncbi:MAG: SBBP repeat-containing protein [Bacteroidetes bacterium]|nr:SBBP repeat-containing protein [Bacteroidota bacterium]